jgi:hypothetical protein
MIARRTTRWSAGRIRIRSVVLSLIGIVVAAIPGLAADQELYFSKGLHVPFGATPLIFETHERIEVALELRTLSIEDRDRFPRLVIDDYRVDEPKHYADGRVPNVRFEIMEVGPGNTLTPASYRVATQGDGGLDVEYHMAGVQFQLGRSRAMYWLVDHLWHFGGLFAQHWPGTYQIRAFYREFVTPPLFVTVK